MKTLFSFLAGIIFLAVLFPSCTVEKRVYMPGYNVQWNNAQHKSKPVESIAAEESASSIEKNEEDAPSLKGEDKTKSPFRDLGQTTASADKKPAIIAKKYTAPVITEFKKGFSQQKEKMNQLFIKKKFISTTKARGGVEVLPIVSMSLGVVSLVSLLLSLVIYSAWAVGTVESYLFAVVGVLLGIAACIMGMFGLKKEKDKLSKMFSIIGIICGGIGMIACIIWFWVMLISDWSNSY